MNMAYATSDENNGPRTTDYDVVRGAWSVVIKHNFFRRS
jgi:hypothetical protein